MTVSNRQEKKIHSANLPLSRVQAKLMPVRVIKDEEISHDFTFVASWGWGWLGRGEKQHLGGKRDFFNRLKNCETRDFQLFAFPLFP